MFRRYNLFIVLYPLGVVGELLTIYDALPFVRRSGMYSMRLPNKYNVSFDYYYCLIIVMLSYIPRKEHFKTSLVKGILKMICNKLVSFSLSVSSALLPHVETEKESSPRWGHSGEGWLDEHHLLPLPPHHTSSPPSSQHQSEHAFFITRDEKSCSDDRRKRHKPQDSISVLLQDPFSAKRQFGMVVFTNPV